MRSSRSLACYEQSRALSGTRLLSGDPRGPPAVPGPRVRVRVRAGPSATATKLPGVSGRSSPRASSKTPQSSPSRPPAATPRCFSTCLPPPPLSPSHALLTCLREEASHSCLQRLSDSCRSETEGVRHPWPAGAAAIVHLSYLDQQRTPSPSPSLPHPMVISSAVLHRWSGAASQGWPHSCLSPSRWTLSASLALSSADVTDSY